MRFVALFKTPDAVNYGLAEASDDAEAKEAAAEAVEKWVKYGELVFIEFDTDAETATVLPA